MTYKEALQFIDDSNKYGSKLGLATITELLRRLDNPQDKLKCIHVAGTNGKGSTTAFISSILISEGYLVGRYISPAVFSYRERIQINTDDISEEDICNTIATIKPICEDMVREGFDHPTSFEIETAMAFLYFAGKNVDFAVIEVGLGGRLDATNVIKKPVCCVITSISMDHMQYLGDTLTKITREKAGIMKEGVPAITGNTEPEVQMVLEQICRERNSELILASDRITDIIISTEGTEFYYKERPLKISLLGEYQIQNSVLAIETAQVLRKLGYSISDTAIREGLLRACWSGRLDIIARDPYFMIDGAHNEDAARKLKNSLLKIFQGKRIIFIMGVLADKDYKKILEITAPLASVIITVTPDNIRALASSELAKEAEQYTKEEVIDAQTIQNAVETAYKKAGKDDVILAFGSLSYLGEIRACVKKLTTSSFSPSSL